jgi:hypothetical protein
LEGILDGMVTKKQKSARRLQLAYKEFCMKLPVLIAVAWQQKKSATFNYSTWEEEEKHQATFRYEYTASVDFRDDENACKIRFLMNEPTGLLTKPKDSWGENNYRVLHQATSFLKFRDVHNVEAKIYADVVKSLKFFISQKGRFAKKDENHTHAQDANVTDATLDGKETDETPDGEVKDATPDGEVTDATSVVPRHIVLEDLDKYIDELKSRKAASEESIEPVLKEKFFKAGYDDQKIWAAEEMRKMFTDSAVIMAPDFIIMAPDFNPYHQVYKKYQSKFKLETIKQLDNLVRNLEMSVKEFRDSILVHDSDSDDAVNDD